ncbi:hypothetical protein MASR2M78_28770 [Treponema sp.]
MPEGLNIVADPAPLLENQRFLTLLNIVWVVLLINVPEGVIRDKVAWFAVIYKFPQKKLLNALTNIQVQVVRVVVLLCSEEEVNSRSQTFKELVVNDDDVGVCSLLSRLLGIPEEIETDVSVGAQQD